MPTAKSNTELQSLQGRVAELEKQLQELRSRLNGSQQQQGWDPRQMTEEQQIAHWAPRGIQSSAENLVHIHQGLYAFLLADDLGAQGGVKVPRIVAADAWVQLVTDGSSHRFDLSPRLVLPKRDARLIPRANIEIVHGACQSVERCC